MERRRGDEGFGWGGWEHKDAGVGFLRQNMMPRRLRAHPARKKKKEKKKGRVTPGGGMGGGGGGLRIRWFALKQAKSKIPQGSSLRRDRELNGLEISEAAAACVCLVDEQCHGGRGCSSPSTWSAVLRACTAVPSK
ncbi:unnamed protein product [Pleuronectes platessa]|uniref:Uncharacterized protein n=1 Tax=Pleuronectes platessa TaxID=8262 RepID=A0A9N7VRX0_PLEPL|nr:unnamed protein product [Pleuronectes platessa]